MDRRRDYDRRQLEAGLRRLNSWVPSEAFDDLKFLIKCLVAANGKRLEDLRDLLCRWERGE